MVRMKKRSLYNKKKKKIMQPKKKLMYISVEMGKGTKFKRKKSGYQIFSCLFNIRIEKAIANT